MSVIMHGTKEEKLKWLLRPVEWASNVAFFSTIFGFVYWYFSMWEPDTLILGLIAVLAVNAGLLIWAVGRIAKAARGY